MKSVLTAFLALCLCANLHAQIDGDNIFSVDQVISIDLVFPQDNFWEELQSNYEADENEYIQPCSPSLTWWHPQHGRGRAAQRKLELLAPTSRSRSKSISTSSSQARTTTASSSTSATDSRTPPACGKVVFERARGGRPAPRAGLPTSPSMAKLGAFTQSWNKSTTNSSIGPSKKTVATCSKGDNFRWWPGGGGGGNNTAADLADYGTDPAVYADRYELKTNEDVNDWSDLVSFIDFINNTDLDAFATGIDFRMDVDGFEGLPATYCSAIWTATPVQPATITSTTTKTPTFGNGSNGTAMKRLAPTPTVRKHGNVGDRLRQPYSPLLERMFDHDDLYAATSTTWRADRDALQQHHLHEPSTL